MTGHRAERTFNRQRAGLAALGTAVALATVTVPPLVLSGRTPNDAHPPLSTSWPLATLPSAEPTATSQPPTTSAPTSPTKHSTPAATTSSIRPPATTTRAPLVPIHIEAEAPDNIFVGGASVTDCTTCSGGKRVRYLGAGAQLIIQTTLSAPGKRLTVLYEVDGVRTLSINVNGAPLYTYDTTGASWDDPQQLDVPVTLAAGQLTLTFYNDNGGAPDLDAVIIS